MQQTTDDIRQKLIEQGLLPLFYHDDLDTCRSVMDALYRSGIRLVEFTNRGENAMVNFEPLAADAAQRWPGLMLGIGTIKTVEEAEVFINAGAAFVVCPGISTSVGDVVQRKGLLWIPGCMTPTEMMMAESQGATLVKLFPGSLLGPQYLQAVRELFPHLKFMVTGGVELEKKNIASWLNAGASVLGLGSKLINKGLLKEGNFHQLETNVQEALQAVRNIRGNAAS